MDLMSGAYFTPDELETLDGLLTTYGDLHPDLSKEQRISRLRQGLVVLADLELDAVHRLLGTEAHSAGHRPLVQTGEIQRLLNRLCALSVEDGLTGLWNRRYFDRRLEQEVLRARRERRCCAVALVDVDHFKRINDTYGHSVGDQVLREIALILRDALRATDDITGRFGGEEFVVLLPDTDVHGGQVAAERLRKAVQAHRIEAIDNEVYVTISAGVAGFDATCCERTAQELIKAADDALYAAKNAGRNQVCVFQGSECGDDPSGVSREERDLLLR